MITITHKPNGGIDLEMPNPMEYSELTWLYVTGDLPPNYPMPAIQYTTDWYLTDGVWLVIVERWYSDQDDDCELAAIYKA